MSLSTETSLYRAEKLLYWDNITEPGNDWLKSWACLNHGNNASFPKYILLQRTTATYSITHILGQTYSS